MNDEKLYTYLAHGQSGILRAYSFDDEDLFDKSQKFLKYLGYEFGTVAPDENDNKYYIHLHNFIVIPNPQVIKEIVDKYMEENKDEK